MSKYRFAGVIKSVEIQPSGQVFRFIPDSEYSVFKKDKDDETKFAVIQPADKKVTGYVFEYTSTVEVLGTGTCPYLTPGVHCVVELDDKLSFGMYKISFADLTNAGKANSFEITVITAL